MERSRERSAALNKMKWSGEKGEIHVRCTRNVRTPCGIGSGKSSVEFITGGHLSRAFGSTGVRSLREEARGSDSRFQSGRLLPTFPSPFSGAGILVLWTG